MIKTLFDALREDRWRTDHPFSDDVRQANQILHHPYASEDEVAETLSLWFERRQPCMFGRIAAKGARIHFCVLSEGDLYRGDSHVRKKLAEEKLLWKRRALDTRATEHSFVVFVNSARVGLAAPDDNLARFARHIRELTGWKQSPETKAPVASDFLYLKSPHDGFYYGFKFNLDFFATAGDGRWWHDHRIPGGIAFTANSTGHMKRFREWYDFKEKPDQGDWVLRLALQTIASAQAVPTSGTVRAGRTAAGSPGADPKQEGRITWLLGLQNGKPRLEGIECPFKDEKQIIEVIKGKDWTTYEGLIQTDHNVRPEFFEDRERPSTYSRPYFNDFTYLYATHTSGFLQFTAGVQVAKEEVLAELGDPSTWIFRAGGDTLARPAEKDAEIKALLDVCRAWVDDSEGSAALM